MGQGAVTHADVDRDRRAGTGQFPFDKASLIHGDFSERAAADEGVAVLDLFDYILRNGSAADHIAQVVGDLLDGFRGSVRQQ